MVFQKLDHLICSKLNFWCPSINALIYTNSEIFLHAGIDTNTGPLARGQ